MSQMLDVCHKIVSGRFSENSFDYFRQELGIVSYVVNDLLYRGSMGHTFCCY